MSVSVRFCPANRNFRHPNKTFVPSKPRVRALQRILNEEFCIESTVAHANGQPPSPPHAFIQRVASAGFRLPMAVHKYLERCRDRNDLPDREDLLRALIPWSRRYPDPAF